MQDSADFDVSSVFPFPIWDDSTHRLGEKLPSRFILIWMNAFALWQFTATFSLDSFNSDTKRAPIYVQNHFFLPNIFTKCAPIVRHISVPACVQRTPFYRAHTSSRAYVRAFVCLLLTATFVSIINYSVRASLLFCARHVPRALR